VLFPTDSEEEQMSLPSLLLVFFLLFIPTLWAIVNIANRDFGSVKKKALWGIFVVFVPPIGGIVYLLTYQISRVRKRENG
jgi:hypothetical protein